MFRAEPAWNWLELLTKPGENQFNKHFLLMEKVVKRWEGGGLVWLYYYSIMWRWEGGGILSPLGMIQVRQFHSYSNIMLIMYIVIQGKTRRVSEWVYDHSPSEATILIKLTGPIILHISCSENRRPLTDEGHSNAQFSVEHLLSRMENAIHITLNHGKHYTEMYEKHCTDRWRTILVAL